MQQQMVKGATGVDTSNLAAKSDLAYLKAQVDEIDVGKQKNVPAGSSKLSNVRDNDVKKLCTINRSQK